VKTVLFSANLNIWIRILEMLLANCFFTLA